MEIIPDTLETYVPYYLTQEQKVGLVSALNDFRTNPVSYYINKYRDELLQGDGWSNLDVIRLENGDRNSIKGIILSNTCDITPENKRPVPARITFAPIIKLSRYSAILANTDLTEQQVNAKIQAIRDQNVTTIFYLPPESSLDDEYIALLDDVHNIPATAFDLTNKNEKVFTLSMFGFYLFLLKLSVHFCRFHEEVTR
jgi:hypothetical protein